MAESISSAGDVSGKLGLDKCPANPRNFDFADRSLFSDGPPYALFERLRREEPVAWSDAPPHWTAEDGPGYWNVTRPEDIATVSQDPATFSSWLGGFLMRQREQAPIEVARTFMIGKDAPEHTQMRGIVNNAFTPRRVETLGPAIRTHLTRLIDSVIESGECDLVTDIATPYTMGVIAEMLGVPEADRPPLYRWTDTLLLFDDPEMAALASGEQTVQDAAAYFMSLVAERERNPQNDLVTAIGQASFDGVQLAREDQAGVFIQLFAAGVDTTRSTIALGMHALINHPEQRQHLIDEPSLLPNGVEEILRWTTVVMHMRRTATRDTVLGGQRIAKGDEVIMWYPSASRDPQFVDNPDVFDVRRSSRRHQAFGAGGPHFCIGAGLARLELRIAFEELLRRMPDLSLAGKPTRVQTNVIQGYKHMPVRFTPGVAELPNPQLHAEKRG